MILFGDNKAIISIFFSLILMHHQLLPKTNGFLELGCHVFPPGEQVRADWSTYSGSMAWRAKDIVSLLR